MSRRTTLAAVGALAGAALAGVLVWRSMTPAPAAPAGGPAAPTAPAYVGSSACESCHPDQSRAWRASQHALAMAEATDTTVRGRFDGATLTYAGVTSTFLRRDGRFLVRTDGADGQLADFQIKYTFGVYPLQQYLVEFPGGRLQALSLAWDARPADAGGQRWFHLYPGERITAGDPLHWTGPQQNWNFMCADCHSTNVRKGYDAAGRRYQTTWSEISVGCEACHGPGDAHRSWAQRRGAPADAPEGRYLPARLDERRGVSWSLDPATQAPRRSAPRTSDREIEVCARCHARRTQLTDTAAAGGRFEDGFRASLLEPALFHHDGQQRDEVYTYASFLQSRMYEKGVTCSDCHDPHSGRLTLQGNALCSQCHLQSRYDTPSHHRHPAASAASACVACHMPSTTYMVVDPRRDHSFQVPRPDLSAKLGVPDACTSACHANRSPAWAAAALRRQNRGRAVPPHPFAEAFHAAAGNAPDAAAGLERLASTAGLSAIVRASALERAAGAGRTLDAGVAAQLLGDGNPLVRRAALAALQRADPATRQRLVPPLLSDPVRTVRSQAVLGLLDLAAGGLSGRAAFDRALEEYLSEQRFNADRAEAQTNLGTAFVMLGRSGDAVAAYNEAISLDRIFLPAYINLADVHRALGSEGDAERVLRQAITVMPAAADAHHSLGLALVRQRRLPEALASLSEAVRLQPDVPRFSYVYAVALHDTGNAAQAIAVLRAAAKRNPSDRDTLSLLSNYLVEAGRTVEARTYAERLAALDPDNPEVRALLQQLRDSGPPRQR